jgi:hypothetical protein
MGNTFNPPDFGTPPTGGLPNTTMGDIAGSAGLGNLPPLPDLPPVTPVTPGRKGDLPEPKGPTTNSDPGTTIIINAGGGSGRKGGGITSGRTGNTTDRNIDGDAYVPPPLPPPVNDQVQGDQGRNTPYRDPYEVAFNNLLNMLGITGQNQNWAPGAPGAYNPFMTNQQGNQFFQQMQDMGYGDQLGQQFSFMMPGGPVAAQGNRANQLLREFLMRMGNRPTGFDLPPTTYPGAPGRGR